MARTYFRRSKYTPLAEAIKAATPGTRLEIPSNLLHSRLRKEVKALEVAAVIRRDGDKYYLCRNLTRSFHIPETMMERYGITPEQIEAMKNA